MENKNSRVCKTATEGLSLLWEQGFFRTWKKKAPVAESFGKWGNHFSDAELGMALKRAKHLTRKGKPMAYEYIQKYPYVREEDTVLSKKKKR